MSKLYLILFFLVLPMLSQGQDITFQNYGVNDGLSSSKVFSVVEDKVGYIWVATEQGVDRFDGKHFEHFELPNLYDYTSTNYIEFRLKTDSNHKVWLVTSLGLIYYYDEIKDAFVLFHMIEDLFDKYVHTFYIDHNDKLLLGVEDGVLIINPETKEVSQINEGSGVTSSIIQDSSNRYYFGTTKGIVVLDANRKYIYNLIDVTSSNISGLKDSRIYSLFIDEENKKLWVGSNSLGLCVFDLINFKFTVPSAYKDYKGIVIKSLLRFSEDEMIVGIDGSGLMLWDLNNYRINRIIVPEINNPLGLSSSSVHQVFQNSSNVFFVATYRGGLSVYKPERLNFQFIKHKVNDRNSIRQNVIVTMCEASPGVIVFGTDRGVSIWDKKSNIWQHPNINKDTNRKISEVIHSLAVDKSKNIWVASWTDSLALFKRAEGNRYVSTRDFPKKLVNTRFKTAYVDVNNVVWFVDEINDRFFCYSIDTKEVREFPFNKVKTMLSVSPDLMAIGTAFGLVFIDSHTGIKQDMDIVVNSILSNTMISSLAIDSNKQLWVGTRSEGLFVVNFFKKTVTQFSKESGLPSNRIFSLAAFQDNIWATTNKGISRIDGKNNISNFTKSDGLVSTDFNDNAVLCDSEGYVYFGTNDGVIMFNPDEIYVKEKTKTFVLDEFFINHKRVTVGDDSPLKRPLNEAETIELSHLQNSFAIDFHSIDFSHSDQGSFQWKLENFDKEWITNQALPQASYTNLNPGKYTFRLRMVNGNDESLISEKSLDIAIMPPLWKTFWAFIFYLIVIILIIQMITYFNGLRITSKNSKDKLHYLVNMAHEIKTPLMLIKAPLTDLLNNNKLDESSRQVVKIAMKNAEKVHVQLIQFLDFRHFKLRKKNLIINPLNLPQFLSDKLFAYKMLADKKNISMSLSTDLKHFIINSDEKIIDKIVGNLLSNAIKYTLKNGIIKIKLSATDKLCKIAIIDSGIGIPPSQKKKIFQLFYRTDNAKDSGSLGTGVGLVLASDLAKQIKGKVVLEETSHKGSIFSLVFPYQLADVEAIKVDESQEVSVIEDNNQLIKVLLVEDDEDMIEFSKSKLNGMYSVATANNGHLALEMIKKDQPQIIISDVVMPRMNGIQLCMNLKSNIDTCHIPFILLTGLGSKDHIIQGLESGADDYIVKPYDYELLFSKMEGLLQNRTVLKRKFFMNDESEEKIEFANELDDNFIKEITKYVEDNISDTSISAKDLCEAMGMSRTAFYHKLKALIDVSPNEFIRTIQLKKGRSMLLKYNYNISEVAYSVGFSDAKYFGTLFKKYFGMTPSAFVAEKNNLANKKPHKVSIKED